MPHEHDTAAAQHRILEDGNTSPCTGGQSLNAIPQSASSYEVDNNSLAPTIVPPLPVTSLNVSPITTSANDRPCSAPNTVCHHPIVGHSSDLSTTEESSLRIPEPKIARRVGKDGRLGSQLTMREVFNRLFAGKCKRSYRKDDPNNPISSEIVRDCLSFVRFQLYVLLKLEHEKGKLTYSKAMKKHGKSIDDLKRRLESRHKILKMAVASWASEMLVKEALRRDRVYKARNNSMGLVPLGSHSLQAPSQGQNNAASDDQSYQVSTQNTSSINDVDEHELTAAQQSAPSASSIAVTGSRFSHTNSTGNDDPLNSTQHTRSPDSRAGDNIDKNNRARKVRNKENVSRHGKKKTNNLVSGEEAPRFKSNNKRNHSGKRSSKKRRKYLPEAQPTSSESSDSNDESSSESSESEQESEKVAGTGTQADNTASTDKKRKHKKRVSWKGC